LLRLLCARQNQRALKAFLLVRVHYRRGLRRSQVASKGVIECQLDDRRRAEKSRTGKSQWKRVAGKLSHLKVGQGAGNPAQLDAGRDGCLSDTSEIRQSEVIKIEGSLAGDFVAESSKTRPLCEVVEQIEPSKLSGRFGGRVLESASEKVVAHLTHQSKRQRLRNDDSI